MGLRPAKRLVILGSTGSIGRATLEVVRHLGDVEVVGLAAERNVEVLAEQARQFRVRALAAVNTDGAAHLRARVAPGTQVMEGPKGLADLAAHPDANLVLVAVVGIAGLVPTLAALDAGKDVALANKETLVAGGALVTAAARRVGHRLLPVDSEHSAIFQCLEGASPDTVRAVILTASGGPFREWPAERAAAATPEEALAHPTWKMGKKITVDSATLMNKGLEVIEAHWLFSLAPDRIRVVIHPQSLVHSMVEFVDGSVLAQLGVPDMRGPIQYALTYPQRRPSLIAALRWDDAAMSFETPDANRYPCLGLAYEALGAGGTMPAVLNAANEVAVSLFLDGRIPFGDIPRVVEDTMSGHRPAAHPSLDDVLGADAWARGQALVASGVRATEAPSMKG